jgi:ribosomal protein S18 acetylase RimI-like enzyme
LCGQGLAAQLLQALEQRARELGKTTLVLDTVTGSAASRVYERLGWQRVGDIPGYALMPDGLMCSTTYYCRALCAGATATPASSGVRLGVAKGLIEVPDDIDIHNGVAALRMRLG